MRPPRIQYPGALMHLMARGVNKMEIFHDARDYEKFLEYVEELKRDFPFKLYSLCLMPNHFHMLIEMIETSISSVMQKLLTYYACRYKERYGWVGHVFQGRFKTILCEAETYLLELIRYIPLNPVRAKMCNDPLDWKWSTHGLYLRNVKDGLADIDMPLDIFSNDRAHAIERYKQFVQDGIAMGHRKDFYPPPSRPFLGSAKWKSQFIRNPAQERNFTYSFSSTSSDPYFD